MSLYANLPRLPTTFPTNADARLSHSMNAAVAGRLLRAAAAGGDIATGKASHACLVKTTHLDVVHHNHLLGLYARTGHLATASQLFDEMPVRNAVSGNLLMSGYSHAGNPRKAIEVFKTMDFEANEYVLATTVAACAEIRGYSAGRQCHGYAVKSGLAEHCYIRNALVHMYCRCSCVDDAMHVFDALPGFDAFAFNSMINGFLDCGKVSESVGIVRRMAREVTQWDHVSYVSVLGHCAGTKDLNLGRQVHAQTLKRRHELNVFVGCALIDMYGKCDSVQDAQRAFKVLPEKNVVSWTAVMAAYAQNELFEDALRMFSKMEIEGVRPNEFTYAVALNSCAALSALRNGDALNAHVEKTGYRGHLSVGNALINMYSKSGSMEDARRVFVVMPHRDIVSWNSIITGYSHHGLAKEVLEAFHGMLAAGEVPSYVTFIGLLSACGHLGLVDEGFHYLDNMMRDVGVAPGKEHYTCMVGLLCRAGRLDEAESFIRSTCIDLDVVAWRTLLSSCQVYRNYGLGHRVAEKILQLNPNDVGTYILLSNMYAKVNRWDGVVKVRKLMRERGIKKEPGVSWIQLGSEVHVFTSEDKKHPWMGQICNKLEELMYQIKLIGYVPNIAMVLHDVGVEQKEEYLQYHSEKLALSFGLMRTPDGSTLHIMKNLRICDDCHVAMKLISVVTGRRIVVRDATRFHRIESGACSCADYW